MATVTNENLAEFMESAKLQNGFDYDMWISDEVKLEDYFAGFAEKSSDEKHRLVAVMERNLYNGASQERKQEVFDLARTNKEAFAHLYQLSGNSTHHGGCFDIVREIASKNKFSDNLYMIDATIGFESHGFSLGEKDDIRSLPKDKAEIMAKLFADAKVCEGKYSHNGNTTIRESYSLQMVRNITGRGDVLNYEPRNVNVAGITPGEIRAKIEGGISQYNIADLDKKFIFDGKRVNKDSLKLLFESQLNKNDFVQTEGEQKVHDAKQMQKYIETRDLVLDAAESVVGKYIPNSRGEERTNTQKFKALIEMFYNKPYEEFSGGKVVQDYLLSAAYRDINAGNSAKLEDDVLRLVVEHDKDGYWLKKINEKSPEAAKKIIKEMNGSFNIRQSRVADIIAPEITLDHGTSPGRTGDIFDTKVYKHQYSEYNKGVASSEAMSTAEKIEFLDKAAVFVDEKLLQKAKADKEFAAEFRKDYAEHDELCNQAYAKEKLRSRLTALQGLYADIVQKFADGQPNEAEKHLAKENIEQTLKDFPNCQGINLPVQGKLPLLFGRKKEEERRIELVQSIRKFHEELMDFQIDVKNPQNKWAKYADLNEYKGKLLETDTIEALKAERDEKNAKVQANNNRLNNKYYGKGQYGGGYNYDDAERAEKWSDLQEQRAQNIEAEKQKVLARKQQLENLAKEVLAPETSGVQAVTSDMDKDTKAAVRKANQQISDVLEKPVTERIKKAVGGRK